jgi:hypothetical protein
MFENFGVVYDEVVGLIDRAAVWVSDVFAPRSAVCRNPLDRIYDVNDRSHAVHNQNMRQHQAAETITIRILRNALMEGVILVYIPILLMFNLFNHIYRVTAIRVVTLPLLRIARAPGMRDMLPQPISDALAVVPDCFRDPKGHEY